MPVPQKQFVGTLPTNTSVVLGVASGQSIPNFEGPQFQRFMKDQHPIGVHIVQKVGTIRVPAGQGGTQGGGPDVTLDLWYCGTDHVLLWDLTSGS